MDEYDTIYSDMLDRSDFTDLLQRLNQIAPQFVKNQNINIENLMQTIGSKFSQFNWFEEIQKDIIKLSLQSGRDSCCINVWDELLVKLQADTRESVSLCPTRLRFAAHLAILLMLHNRLTRPDEYNKIV